MRENIRTVCAVLSVLIQIVALHFIITYHPR